jgi:hypothetical protein
MAARARDRISRAIRGLINNAPLEPGMNGEAKSVNARTRQLGLRLLAPVMTPAAPGRLLSDWKPPALSQRHWSGLPHAAPHRAAKT